MVHCIHEDLFGFKTVKKAGATGIIDELILFAHPKHLVAIDNNGIPRFHRNVETNHRRGRYSQFKAFMTGPDQAYQYAYPHHTDSGLNLTILDQELELIDDSVTTVSPLAHTDSHDFQVLENGNYMLMSYEQRTAT